MPVFATHSSPKVKLTITDKQPTTPKSRCHIVEFDKVQLLLHIPSLKFNQFLCRNLDIGKRNSSLDKDDSFEGITKLKVNSNLTYII